ncbi:hypothetical protein O6H91_02G116300 [Diphasiastrum complanatum]|uniref:Uncharacterized protein n=1 Tax=Diphasiastrum complanatum TaxID=34168 RepID=A0ACC2EJT5_DIPCM|nr:hypothetical protein O6H91_02G116300 [Diphasiastrum complanatum]
MLRHISASALYLSKPTWWLESRFHFSFAEYYAPKNMEFGVLRVLNDDLVKPRSGFETHPHRDMEIFTYVVDGQLTHKDSMGTAETLGRGCVQYMSAGRGVTHSEKNKASNEMLRFLQIWIKPNRTGLTPNYGSRVFSKEDRHNKLQHVATSYDGPGLHKDTGEGIIPMHQDVNIYVSEAEAGAVQEFVLQSKRQAYLVCIEGALSANESCNITARDALEIKSETMSSFSLKLEADNEKGAHFLLVEMAAQK